MLRVDTTAAERQLEAIPWVDDARVTTDFPNGAKIEIRERRPMIAYLATDGRYRVLDSDGRVLDVIAGRPVDYLELEVDDGADARGRTARAALDIAPRRPSFRHSRRRCDSGRHRCRSIRMRPNCR